MKRIQVAAREITPTTVGKVDVTSPIFTYLHTARVWVMGPTGRIKLTRCALDGGSQSSLIAKILVDDLKLEVVECRYLLVRSFELWSYNSNPRIVVRFGAKSMWKNTTVPIIAFKSTRTCPHPTFPLDSTIMAQTRKIQLADPREG